MIIYKLDSRKPYCILGYNKDTGVYTIAGTVMKIDMKKEENKKRCPGGFGGFDATWKMRERDFLTYDQKKDLRWTLKHKGQKTHDKLLAQFLDSAVAGHIEKPS